MAQQITPYQIGNLSAEDYAQQQQIMRQQRMAQALMQNTKAPQGQMVGNQFVAPSFFQNLQPIANALAGSYIDSKADKATTALATKLRNNENIAIADYMATLKGRPASEKAVEMAGPFGQSGSGANVPMPTAIQDVPAVAADPYLANLNASTDRRLPEFLRQNAQKELTKGPKWEKAEYTDEKTGTTRQGVIDVNSPDPISTFQIGGTKPSMSAYERANLNIRGTELGMRGAELADKGIITTGGYGAGYGGGQPTNPIAIRPTNQPLAQPLGQSAPKLADPYAPSTIPQYENDPSLTPAQNREQSLAFSKETQKLIKNAKNSFDLLKATAAELRENKASSGRLENTFTGAREVFGGGGDASKADAVLKIYGAKLTQQVPRFEGPQSDKDTAMYQAAAGDVGNANVPIPTRLAAVQTMIGLNKKYYPKGDWDSIKLDLPNSGKVSLGPVAKEVDFGSLPTGRR